MTIKPTIDFNSPAFHANPYPFYHELRVTEPVYWAEMPPPLNGMWLCTRYADVASVLKEARLTKHRLDMMRAGEVTANQRSMLSEDPPDHTRLRSLVSQAFTPKRVQGLQSRIEEVTNHLIEQVAGQGGMDFVTAIAQPLPVIVIAELLGVPPEDRHEFQAWSNTVITGGDGARRTAERGKQSNAAILALDHYFRKLIEQRRREPRNDLISALIAARDVEERLNEEELLSTCRLLLIAGFETTVNLLSNGLLALLQHPEQRMLLQANPALVGSAVEEMLRYYSPVQRATYRGATETFMIGDKQIQPGEAVSAIIGAANRDPAVFPDPNRFDITRTPNPHLGFGLGIHFCLGAPLARLEGRVAFTTLLERLPGLQLLKQEPDWSSNTFIRGLRSLAVEF